MGRILAHSGAHMLPVVVGAAVILVAASILDRIRKRRTADSNHPDQEESLRP
jgi:hypothetical protein